ncbi:heavy metal translocating P-type ATPase [Streptococcus iniae]|uniref:P-type Cu(+) transporter n=1 Tax=Streptococcus iniae TaxID=1346 RepID=A0A3M2PNT9_STRIN|nr:heavy metal translocating P-type ATPase [Streptococcus iniae]AHY16389.1 ATPase P [Streptococcus iniae]AHY18252.1 ATPase P [Streptococcus iniae]ASL35377.1 copper-transporting ATPase [Streptococcus iniae]ELY5747215.1 copper-translocating P-type ATPase [Streptococcus iniae]ESR10554.1 ActP protein [Streptococcus iniae IUSA1]
MTKESFLIEGMTCASCALSVENAVKRLPGVDQASVNLTTEKLSVDYQDETINPKIIEKAVAEAGYQATRYLGKQDKSLQERQDNVTQRLWRQFICSAIFTIPVVYLAMGSMIGLPVPFATNLKFQAILQFFLTLPVLYFNKSYFTNGFNSLFKQAPNMNSLVALATTVSFLFSTFALAQVFKGHLHYLHQLYFESAVVILTLITLGNFFEASSKSKTSESLQKLLGLKVTQARLVKDGISKLVDLEEITVGQTLMIKPGEKVPLDGYVLSGSSFIDESMLTGESIPNEKISDSPVYAGTINGQGNLLVRVSKSDDQTFLSQMIDLVEEAQATKAPIAKIADQLSGRFVPFVIVLSLLTVFFWFFLMQESFHFALTAGIAVLVIACPCALGLATPTAIMVGSGRAAHNGILFKGGDYLENLHQVKTIVFDKTGTITQGQLQVTSMHFLAQQDPTLLQAVASLEQYSEHPISTAIVQKAKENGLTLEEVSDFKAHTGMGVKGKDLIVGNAKLMAKEGIKVAEIPETSNETVIYVAKNQELVAYFLVSDQLKADSQKTIFQLKKMGIKTIMLTGDQESVAKAIAKKVGIDKVYSQVLPDQKASIIAALQKEFGPVAMVGDGINDAPALATAAIGIAMGTGTDIAIEAADVILMKPQMLDLVKAVQLSQATIKVVKENLFWAFIYNLLMIPIAMGVLHLFGGPLLNPMFAGLAMSLSSVSVVLNALRLKTIRIEGEVNGKNLYNQWYEVSRMCPKR